MVIWLPILQKRIIDFNNRVSFSYRTFAPLLFKDTFLDRTTLLPKNYLFTNIIKTSCLATCHVSYYILKLYLESLLPADFLYKVWCVALTHKFPTHTFKRSFLSWIRQIIFVFVFVYHKNKMLANKQELKSEEYLPQLLINFRLFFLFFLIVSEFLHYPFLGK